MRKKWTFLKVHDGRNRGRGRPRKSLPLHDKYVNMAFKKEPDTSNRVTTKRGRGRPRKNLVPLVLVLEMDLVYQLMGRELQGLIKRDRGRPRKAITDTTDNDSVGTSFLSGRAPRISSG
ncbi:hypothetical protein POM88_051064 [Heracleum sosnowskyi]|uniref:Uncharacterized protein n=1 Tax=Heracleum sosnowskyi TaxID=360622 RepID=A0AAD8H182_9APIA|nr:hypothetical protein POM88_051064 [Heracleum sosnowskyi]